MVIITGKVKRGRIVSEFKIMYNEYIGTFLAVRGRNVDIAWSTRESADHMSRDRDCSAIKERENHTDTSCGKWTREIFKRNKTAFGHVASGANESSYKNLFFFFLNGREFDDVGEQTSHQTFPV